DMLAAPSTEGLYAGAVAQSFGVTPMQTLDAAERAGVAFAGGAGARELEALRALPAEALLARDLAQPHPWMPIVAGDFLPRPVRETFAAGRQHRVPLLTGWNADEGTTFIPPGDVAPDALRARLQRRLGALAGEAERFYPAGDGAQARAS